VVLRETRVSFRDVPVVSRSLTVKAMVPVEVSSSIVRLAMAAIQR